MVTWSAVYRTPPGFDDLRMIGEGDVLTGLGFEKAEHGMRAATFPERDLPIFRETRRWLDAYFAGSPPDWMPRWQIADATPFRREVIGMLLSIPFGKTATYGEIAADIARRRGLAKMSAQAVGGAVGWNPLCILIPCHRVVGAGLALTGYGGGLENKLALLRHEGWDVFCIERRMGGV